MRKHWIVYGAVQGVGFRAWITRHARTLGLHGWIMNLPDGNVEVEVEGEKNEVASLERRLHEGPSGARVDKVVEHNATEERLASDFSVRWI